MANESLPPAPTITEEQRFAAAKMDYEQHAQEIPIRLQFQQDLALAALKGLTLVNGGAIVGLLTFIGNRATSFDQALLGFGLIAFVLGLVFNLAAYIFGYFAQATFMDAIYHQSWNDQRTMFGIPKDNAPDGFEARGTKLLAIGIAVAVSSLVSFGVGAGLVAAAFFTRA